MADITVSSVDLQKSFDLNGTNNDEMLRLYLRAAGLSDEIHYLKPEERKAFIYDIIKSKKAPGQWLPATMKTPPPILSKPFTPPSSPNVNTARFRKSSAHSLNSLSSMDTQQNLCYATINTSGSSGNLQNYNDVKSSPILPQRFARAPPTPPSPSTVLIGGKGSRFEISGPSNFQHIAGDMTRDMSRNAFDLSSQNPYDNVLNKYMKEHGITQDQIEGMRKQDVIRNIVQSKYTWMPNRFKNRPSINTSYQTVERSKISAVETPSPQPSFDTEPSSPIYLSVQPNDNYNINSKPNISNFKMCADKFADPSMFPTPDSLFDTRAETVQLTNSNNTAERQQIFKPAPPPPPPRKTKQRQNADSANENPVENLYSEPVRFKNTGSRIIEDNRATYLRPNDIVSKGNNHPVYMQYNAKVPQIPPPPPPALPTLTTSKANYSKVDGSVPPPPPPPAPSTAVFVPPPPPPPTTSVIPPPPPPPVLSAGMPPAPPPITPALKLTQNSKQGQTTDDDNSRDAFLESIRKGVNLKKVDKKSATISGIKPRAELSKPPPTTDFLSELKMGLTLRRVKNPEHNPYASHEPDESEV